jgi:hypothetical protein
MAGKPRGSKAIVPLDHIESRILLIRGQKVILDSDLATLYGTSTKRLNEQVRRNAGRFPRDFLFRLSKGEKAEVVANRDHLARLKFSPGMPAAFTEHGAIMAASVLNSRRAVEVSVFVVRAFVNLRRAATAHKVLAQQLDKLERKVAGHDRAITDLIETMRSLITPPVTARRRPIGFAPWKDEHPD